MRNKILILLGFIAIGLASCKKDDTTTTPVDNGGNTTTTSSNRVTMTAGPLKNRVLDLTGTTNSAYYSTGQRTTFINLQATIDSFAVSATIQFITNSKTTVAFSADNFVHLDMVNVHNASSNYGYSSKQNGGNITITKYDAVGGKIEGTYQGSFIDDKSGAVVTVKDGSFSVVRGSDIP
jgi:hypothetical protein